jgi:hypothetical protein
MALGAARGVDADGGGMDVQQPYAMIAMNDET